MCVWTESSFSSFSLKFAFFRRLVRSADSLFQDAVRLDGLGDEEKAFIMYMRYFAVIRVAKSSGDYRKNKVDNCCHGLRSVLSCICDF